MSPNDIIVPKMVDPDKDTDSQCMGILMFNLFSLTYQPESSSPTDFYNQYRDLVIASLKKKELILANVLGLIDSHLPGYLRDHWYFPLRIKSRILMDYKTDIFTQVVPTFLAEILLCPKMKEAQWQGKNFFIYVSLLSWCILGELYTCLLILR